jgi:sugar-phosphatase
VADPVVLLCRAILFDLDGVLVDSRRCVEQVIREWARIRGLDPEPFLRIAYGRKTSDTLRIVAPGLDIDAEVAVLDRMEEGCTDGLESIPGAAELVRSLPVGRWGIVTSGHRAVATLRLTEVGLPVPSVLVTGDEVSRGKPDPQPYLVGLQRLGFGSLECVVIEDAPAGIAAAQAAGIRVIGLRTTHTAGAMREADFQVQDLSRLLARVTPEGLSLTLLM